MKFTVTNPVIGAVITWLYRKKTKTLGFTYEKSFYDDDIIYSQFKINYIKELREKTEEFISQIEREDENV